MGVESQVGEQVWNKESQETWSDIGLSLPLPCRI